MQKQEELMLSRRQKTLSSISNYLPLHIILNQPAGVSFSITVPKSFTVEQLARQIEAEYAFLVEREVGHSRYPVIECGALFDHVDPRAGGEGTENEDDSAADERDEAESRGVQLRFSDRVEDVLDRNSTVHVVNIDQGLGMGRKLSLTNLALAVNHDNAFSDDSAAGPTMSSSAPHQPAAPSISTKPAHLVSATTVVHKSGSDPLSLHSSMVATVVSTPTSSPSSGEASPTIKTEPQLHASRGVSFSNSQGRTAKAGSDVRASTATADTATLVASPFVSSSSLSSMLHGDSQTCQTAKTSFASMLPQNNAWRPSSTYSTATEATTAIAGNHHKTDSKSSSFRPRSRATDILLNLESSSNDSRFQEILHNTIALDHFRQFCFQEYSIENLLFWMDVELFAKPGAELLQMSRETTKEEQSFQSDKEDYCDDFTKEPHQMDTDQFAVQHARYIYLTYIDSCGPLQVNLSDESRTDIPWPILDYQATAGSSTHSSVVSSPRFEKKKNFLWGMSGGNNQKKEDEVVGWPLDRHMFDGAQEHTYQLMKGHTLVRFEESDLWKAVEKIMEEQPEEYAKAMIQGPLNSHYRPDISVILSTVKRSRSRHPSAKPMTLYNWNNSTSDLDRSRDKEEALAKTMNQYFGPIPPSVRHPSRVILGLGRSEDDFEDGFEGFDTCEDMTHGEIPTIGNAGSISSKRSSTSSTGIKKSRFTKRLSGGIVGRGSKGLSNGSDEMMDFYHDDHENDSMGIDAVENGKRTTRWMVAGYFNDQVRLTAAQRKRLLRRNNKLTKFFGSRVDGTLRPVEEFEEGTFGSQNGLAGSNSAPSLGSPLAYALSSSTIHDMDKKRRGKKSSSANSKATKVKKGMMGSAGGSEVLLLLPGGKANRSKSANILQKFKKNSGDSEDDAALSGFSAFSSRMAPGHPFDAGCSPLSSRSSLFSSKKSGANGRGSGHHRSMTATDLQQHRRILAHPHPLWSGSLSDQEGVASTAYERRRGLSILSIMGANVGGTPATPTSPMPGLFSTPLGADGFGSTSFDRQAMSSRRKKADKLSTFFGAQLTTLELSSQLPMEHEDVAHQDSGNSNRPSSDSSAPTLQRVTGPTVSSVNQLSQRERTILWKRNKKLRGLLGESLPESEVALALTRPVLLGSFGTKLRAGRRVSVGGKILRKKRNGSLHSGILVSQDDSEDDAAEYSEHERESTDEYDPAELDRQDEGASNSATARSNVGAAKGKGRVVKRNIARSRRPSTVSVSSRRSQTRVPKGPLSGSTRPQSNYSFDSYLTVDLLTASTFRENEDLDDPQEFDYQRIPPSPSSRRGRSSKGYKELSVNTMATAADESPETMSRFHRKKKMDKIQQFLGDRVPEQDLWMGTVGREKTQEMLDMNLLSPTSSTGTASPHSFNRHGFSVKSKSKSGNTVAEQKGALPGAAPAAAPGGARLERSLSDPPTHFFGRLKQDGESEEQQHQQQPQQHRFSTASRLRQQLASPISPILLASDQTGDMSGIGQLLARTSKFSPTTSGLASPASIATTSAASMGGTVQNPLALLQDYDDQEDPDDESAQILPRLQAMSDKDQERFLKRAEKLERYFGQFPPSALLESSLTTFPFVSGLRGSTSMDAPLGHEADAHVEGAAGAERGPSQRQRSLAELAGLLANVEGTFGGKKSQQAKDKDKDKKRSKLDRKKTPKSSGRSSEDTVESLGLPDAQPSFKL